MQIRVGAGTMRRSYVNLFVHIRNKENILFETLWWRGGKFLAHVGKHSVVGT